MCLQNKYRRLPELRRRYDMYSESHAHPFPLMNFCGSWLTEFDRGGGSVFG